MSSFIKAYKVPILAGFFSVLLYWFFAFELVRSDFLRLLGLYAGLFVFAYILIKYCGWNFWLLAGFGTVFRLVFYPAIPNLSQDFYRFILDGQLMASFTNPYLYTPLELQQNTALLEFGNLNMLIEGMGNLNASHYSNYPPVNQLFFLLADLFPGKSILSTVVGLRTLIILADLGTLYVGKRLLGLLGMPKHTIFWFFLNPFIIIECTGNLHFEGVMLFFLLAGLYQLFKQRWIWAAVLIGLSVSVKLIPLLFLPLFFRYFVRKGAVGKGLTRLSAFYTVAIGTVAITFAPFLSSEFIANFSKTISLWFQDFEFNASVYYIIRYIGFQTIGWNIIADVGKVLPVIVFASVLLLSFFRRNETPKALITAMLLAVSIYFLLSTTVHPWYIATPLLLGLFTRYRYALLWSFMGIVSYAAYGANGFDENLWWVALEYVVVIGYAIWELALRKDRSGL
ncbi:MAG: glycosyltransferase 87 family protein [Bacteroidota bacterium]